MSKQLTITVPDKVAAAMDAKGRPFDLSGGEWLKNCLIMSAQGCDLPLRLASTVPSGSIPEAPEQMELTAAGLAPAKTTTTTEGA